ncbi:MAG: zf-HC2 domain-containing protein [candidate division NC10 bacterium]|nr:zf-HC2 domain-containing protein [candidate division NC10 bacterium]
MKRLTCEQAVQQFFAYLDRALSAEPLEALEAHMEACLDCCDKLRFSRQLDSFVKTRLPEATLPADLDARIRKALRG